MLCGTLCLQISGVQVYKRPCRYYATVWASKADVDEGCLERHELESKLLNYIGHYIREYSRVIKGNTRSLDHSSYPHETQVGHRLMDMPFLTFLGSRKCRGLHSEPSTRGIPKIRGTLRGVRILRTIIPWGLYWGSLILGNYHFLVVTKECKKPRNYLTTQEQLAATLGMHSCIPG